MEGNDSLLNNTSPTVVLDRSVIKKIRKLNEPSDGALVAELSDLFLASVPTLVIKMKKAFDQVDLGVIAEEAHQLKSAAAKLAAVNMCRLALRMKEAATAKENLRSENFWQS